MKKSLSKLSRVSSLLILSGISLHMVAGGMEPVPVVEQPRGHFLIGGEVFWANPNLTQTGSGGFHSSSFSYDYVDTWWWKNIMLLYKSGDYTHNYNSNYQATWAADIGYMFANESFIKGHWRQMNNINQDGSWNLDTDSSKKSWRDHGQQRVPQLNDELGYPVGTMGWGDVNFDGGSSITTTDHWDFNMADIMLGQVTHPTVNLSIAYSVGASYLKAERDFTVNEDAGEYYKWKDQVIEDKGLQEVVLKDSGWKYWNKGASFSSTFTGWGPRVALDASYHMDWLDNLTQDSGFRLGVVGGVASSFYFGEIKSNAHSHEYKLNQDESLYVCTNEGSKSGTDYYKDITLNEIHWKAVWTEGVKTVEGFNLAGDLIKSCRVSMKGGADVVEANSGAKAGVKWWRRYHHSKYHGEGVVGWKYWANVIVEKEDGTFKEVTTKEWRSDNISRTVPELDAYAGLQVGYDFNKDVGLNIQAGWKAFHFFNLDNVGAERVMETPEFQNDYGVSGPYVKLDLVF